MRLGAVLRLRCPRCFEGRVYASLFRMHEACPSCGLVFEREPGYFVGAMYFGYGLALAAGLPPFLLLLGRGLPPFTVGAVVTAWIAVCAPVLWRYSRVIWLHMDQRFDPR